MYRLPDALRPALAKPFGPIHDTRGALKAAKGQTTLIAVGDVVTQTFLDGGVVPKLMIIDGVTQRGAKVEGALRGLPTSAKRVKVSNPAATITKPLIVAIDRALKDKGTTLLHVEGEEDLAALPAMIVAPDGALVCYGQPNEGVVVVTVNAETRRRAQDILNQMDVK